MFYYIKVAVNSNHIIDGVPRQEGSLVSIPNTAVKVFSAEDNWGAPCESRQSLD